MGPQLDSCGRAKTTESAQAPRRALQWGRNLIVAEGRIQRPLLPVDRGLQWGRNLIVAEGFAQLVYYFALLLASMGPQLDSCGRETTKVSNMNEAASFNGAAT